VQASATARLLIAGQAPGRKTHDKGIPFDDPSGDRLRVWLGLTRDQFYDASRIAIVPMGFCYPGTGKGGDLPPRPECALLWREALLSRLPALGLVLVIGRYALDWHMPAEKSRSLSEVMHAARPDQQQVVLPHPSPRNIRWLRQNPWFEADTLPALRHRIAALIG
jgi:uracil-DNA glycosylase